MLAPYLFIICLDYVLRTSIDKIKENGFELTKKRSRRYPATTITDADYADDIAILANTPDQAETLLHSLERAAASIGHIYISWPNVVEGDPKALFSIATTRRCGKGWYFFGWITLLAHSSCLIVLRVLSKEVSSTIFESLVWLDPGLNPCILNFWRTLLPLNTEYWARSQDINCYKEILGWIKTHGSDFQVFEHQVRMYVSKRVQYQLDGWSKTWNMELRFITGLLCIVYRRRRKERDRE